MRASGSIDFAHDYDSDLYMFSTDPEARSWQVTLHGADGERRSLSVSKFRPYPGCDPHEGEAAWLVEGVCPQRIEITPPGKSPFFVDHPDLESRLRGN